MDKLQTAEEMTRPPFPDSITFKEMLEGLFNLDFMTPEEQKTIFDAGEMYANGCIKQEAARSLMLLEALEKIINSWNDRTNGEKEVLKTNAEYGFKYWSPVASLVDSETIANARKAISSYNNQQTK